MPSDSRLYGRESTLGIIKEEAGSCTTRHSPRVLSIPKGFGIYVPSFAAYQYSRERYYFVVNGCLRYPVSSTVTVMSNSLQFGDLITGKLDYTN